ncbi:RNA methyltransferase [Deltaproteobacteria bacterium TL4]
MTPEREKLVEAYYKNKIQGVELFIDNVFDPHNVAAISRTADGLGIETMNLYYTYNQFPEFTKEGKKSSSSATKWIKFHTVETLAPFVEEKKKQGFIFFGCDLNASAQQLPALSFPEKSLIVLGAESLGLSSEIKAICDEFLYIPMVGVVESFNISVAAAIIMYEVFRQKGTHLQCSSEYVRKSPNRNSKRIPRSLAKYHE